jgi:hypothetical protein
MRVKYSAAVRHPERLGQAESRRPVIGFDLSFAPDRRRSLRRPGLLRRTDYGP